MTILCGGDPPQIFSKINKIIRKSLFLGPKRVPHVFSMSVRSFWSRETLGGCPPSLVLSIFWFFQHPNMTNILIIIVFRDPRALGLFPSARGCCFSFHQTQHHLPGWPGCRVMIISSFFIGPAEGRPSAGPIKKLEMIITRHPGHPGR